MPVEKGRIQARRRRHHLAEQRRVTLVARRREPLDLMFLGSGAIAQQLRHGAVQPAQRIGIIPLALRLNLRVLRVPARPAAEIAVVIEREHGRLFKRRCEKRRCGVGLVMLHHGDLRLGELIAQDAVHLATPARARTAAPRPRIPPHREWFPPGAGTPQSTPAAARRASTRDRACSPRWRPSARRPSARRTPRRLTDHPVPESPLVTWISPRSWPTCRAARRCD